MTICIRCSFDDDGRRDYNTLRMRFFSDAYAYCRQMGKLSRQGKAKKIHPESEYFFSYEQTNYTPEFYAIEELMVEVIFLTINAGREGEELFEKHKNRIMKILQLNDIHQMLSNLPDEERNEFINDLKALGIDEL